MKIRRRIVAFFNESGLEWWVELVRREFAFLQEYGFVVDEIHIHPQGNYVFYRRPDWLVAVTYEPESTRTMDVQLSKPPGEPHPVSLDVILAKLAPGSEAPSLGSLDHETVTANEKLWARGLRKIAGPLFNEVDGLDLGSAHSRES